MKEYKKRLKQVKRELQTASGIKHILLQEEKEQLEFLIIRAA